MVSEVDGTWQKLGVKICPICQFKASDDGVFQAHVCRRKKDQIAIRFKKQLNVFTCCTCKIEQNRFDFTEHLQCHLLEKPFECNYCDKDFETKNGLYSHFKLLHHSMPKCYSLRLEQDTEKYLEKARNNGLVFITSVRTNLASEFLQICHTSESPEIPLKLQDLSSKTNDTHNSPMISCIPGNKAPFFTENHSQVSVSSVVPVVALLSQAETPISPTIPSYPARTKNAPSKSDHHNDISPAFSIPTSFSIEQHTPLKASVPSGDSISQSCLNTQTSQPQTSQLQIVSSTSLLPATKRHAPKVPHENQEHQPSVSPATTLITQLTKDPSSSESSFFSSGDRVTQSRSNFQNSFSSVVFQTPQLVKAVPTYEKPPFHQRGLESQLHLGPQTSLSYVHSATKHQSNYQHLCGRDSLSHCKPFPSSINHSNVQPRVSGIFSTSYPSPSSENVSQLRTDPQRLIPSVVTMTPQLTARWPVSQMYQGTLAFQAPVSPVIFPNNQSSKRMPDPMPNPRPYGAKSSQSVKSSSRAVLPPSIHLNSGAQRGLSTFANFLPATKDGSAQSSIVEIVPQVSVTHESVNSCQQNSPTSTETVAANEHHVQDVLIQPGAIDLSVVKIDSDPELKLPVEENLYKDPEYFLNIFYVDNEIIFVCSKCKLKFKERAPFFHHIWKNHAHTSGDSQCCSSIYNESCIHLQRIIKLLKDKAMGLFNIQLEKKKVSVCANEVLSSVQDQQVPLLSEQQPLLTSTESDCKCQPKVSKCLEILKENPNCITQLQIKVEEIKAAKGLGDEDLTVLSSSNEVPSKVRDVLEESGADNISNVGTIGYKDSDVMKNFLNQRHNVVTNDFSAVGICEENTSSNILLNENFQSQKDKPSENLFSAKSANEEEGNSYPEVHMQQGDHNVDFSGKTKAFDHVDEASSFQIQLNEEKTNGDANKDIVPLNVQLEKSQFTACTNKVLPSVKDEEISLSSELQQFSLPPSVMTSGSVHHPNMSKCLEILTGDPDCIKQLQTTVEEAAGETGMGKKSLTGQPSSNEGQSKTREVCEESGSGSPLNVVDKGDEGMPKSSSSVEMILTCGLNAANISDENTESNMSIKSSQVQNDKVSKNLASEKDANNGKESANSKICLQKGPIINVMPEHITTEMEEGEGNPHRVQEITEIKNDNGNGANSSNLSHKNSASKIQMKIREMHSKSAEDGILPENKEIIQADHFREQLMSDTKMKPRENREENYKTNSNRLIVKKIDKEKRDADSSEEAFQELSGNFSMNPIAASCRNEDNDGSNTSQIGKDSCSVMTIRTQTTSDASKSERDYTTDSKHEISESGSVQNSSLEQTNDNSKFTVNEESQMMAESSSDILSNFFKCAFPDCDFSSCLPVDLLTHNQEVHGMECIFSCFYCGFEAKSTSQLLHHMDFHLDLTCDSYSGTIWKNSFLEKITVVVNKVLGTTMNAIECESRNIENVGYSCNFCGGRFTSLKALGCHFEDSTLRTYSCRYCRAHFLDSKSAEKHIREEHPKLPLFRRQHRKLLCKDRVLNKESFSKLFKLRQKLGGSSTNGDFQGEEKVTQNCQMNPLNHSPSNSIEGRSVAQNEIPVLTISVETNEVHKGNTDVSVDESSCEIDVSEGREGKEDMPPPQNIITLSQPFTSCGDEAKSNLTAQCHESSQKEAGNKVDQQLLTDIYIPKPCNSSMEDQPAFPDFNNSLFTINDSALSRSLSSESVTLVRENTHSPLASNENLDSTAINTKSSTVPQITSPKEGVTTTEGENSLLQEKMSANDSAASKFQSNKPKKMPRIYDLCAEKSTAECLSSLYSQIQDGLFSCNSCCKKLQRLRSMLCHIFFCQGKISVVNCPYNCAFESEHPKVIVKHIQGKHPREDPTCKSFRCINVNMFFQYLKDKDVNQIVLEKACKMQNGHTTEMRTFRNKIKGNTFKGPREAHTFHQGSVDNENGTTADYQHEKGCKFNADAEVRENQDSSERKVLKVKKRSNNTTSPDTRQNRSGISQSKVSKTSLVSEMSYCKESTKMSSVENEVEIKSLCKSHSDVETEFADKTMSVLSVTDSEKQELETKKLQADPFLEDINAESSKLLPNKNPLYRCKLCHFEVNFDINCMIKHIGEKHSLFTCGYCERPYSNVSILKNHIRFFHNKSPPKFQQISPELIFTRVDSPPAQTSLVTSQNEENRDTSFGGPKSSQTPLPSTSLTNLRTVYPNDICKEFPEESMEKYREKDDHPDKSTSSVLKANDLNCQHLGEMYLGSNHGKDGKISDKDAPESCCPPDFTAQSHPVPKLSSPGKQTLNDKKPKSVEIKDKGLHKNFKENFSQIRKCEPAQKDLSSQLEQNSSLSDVLIFFGNKEISLKRKADEILNDDFLYNQQQTMKKRCCDKLVHRDTWEMEIRCGADLSSGYSQHTNYHPVREISPEYTHEGNGQICHVKPAFDPGPEYSCEVKKSRSELSLEIQPSFLNSNHYFTSGEGLKNKVRGQPFTCKICLISLPSVSEMKLHFADDHVNEKAQWFEQRMETDYSPAGEKLYHRTDVRPSVTKYLCGYCIFQSPLKESICKHMASAHNSMEYHFVLPTTEGDPVAYTERCCVTDEEEASIACKHEIPSAEKSRSKLRYQCHLCDTCLNSEFLFRLHLAKHEGFKHCSTLSSTRGLLLCATCGYVASSSHDLASHVNRHMTERRYSCSYCGFDDHKRKGVYVHIRKYHGEGSSAYAVDNEQQNRDIDIRPKLVDLNPIVCVRDINDD